MNQNTKKNQLDFVDDVIYQTKTSREQDNLNKEILKHKINKIQATYKRKKTIPFNLVKQFTYFKQGIEVNLDSLRKEFPNEEILQDTTDSSRFYTIRSDKYNICREAVLNTQNSEIM